MPHRCAESDHAPHRVADDVGFADPEMPDQRCDVVDHRLDAGLSLEIDRYHLPYIGEGREEFNTRSE